MPAMPPPPPPATAGLPTARGIQNYTANTATEISFQLNEILTVHKADASGWSEVTNRKGERGWVPSNWMAPL
jgi:hypothetical protein